MGIEQIITVGIQYGLPTVLLFLVSYGYYKKDKAFELERAALYKSWIEEQRIRIDDAKVYHESLRKTQVEVYSAVEKLTREVETRELQRESIEAIKRLGTMIDAWERRDHRDERVERVEERPRGPGDTGRWRSPGGGGGRNQP